MRFAPAWATGPLAPDESFVQSFYGGRIFEGIHRGSLHLASCDRIFEAVSRNKIEIKTTKGFELTHSVPQKVGDLISLTSLETFGHVQSHKKFT